MAEERGKERGKGIGIESKMNSHTMYNYNALIKKKSMCMKVETQRSRSHSPRYQPKFFCDQPKVTLYEK